MAVLVGLSTSAWLGSCGGSSTPDPQEPTGLEACAGTRTDNGDGTTTIACLDGTKDLVCSHPDCSGITNLRYVGTDFARVVMPNLTHVMTDMCEGFLQCHVTFEDNPLLTTISLPSLVMTNQLSIRGNGALTGLSLDALVGGAVVVEGTALSSLRLPALAEPWLLTVSSNPVLTRLEAQTLAELWDRGDLTIRDNAALTGVSFPALASINGSLEVSDNAALTGLSLPALTTIGGDMSVQDNPSYPQCAAETILRQLIDFAGTATISGNDTTATCSP
jgi:hypothetical protein